MAVAALSAAYAGVSAQPDVVVDGGEGVPPARDYGGNHSLEELPVPDPRAVELPAPETELSPVAELPAPLAPETELPPAAEPDDELEPLSAVTTSAAAPSAGAITNDDVGAMVSAEFSDSTIVAIIGANLVQFDLSPRALVALKSGGVSERVIEAMIAAEAEKKRAAVPASAEPVAPVRAPPRRPRRRLRRSTRG